MGQAAGLRDPRAALAPEALACLVAERRESERGLWLAKPLASATFVWAALAWGALASPFGRWLALGLVACAVGDVLLIPRRAPGALRAGMLAFGVGHGLFATAFLVHGVSLGAAALAAAAAHAFVLGVWRWLARHLAPADRVPVGLYAGVIGGMLVCAIGAAARGAPGAAAAGAVRRTASWRRASRARSGACLPTTRLSCCSRGAAGPDLR